MTQRSILAGKAPQLVIRAGGDVLVQGWEGDRILAETQDRGGLQIKPRGGGFEIQMGGGGQVRAPFGSSITVYAGKNAEIQEVHGKVSAYAGQDLRLRKVNVLAQASAGKSLEIDCRTVAGEDVRFSAGRDLRCRIRELDDARYLVDDLGGKWEITFGEDRVQVQLKAGGDVILITGREGVGRAPNYVMGKIERPNEGG